MLQTFCWQATLQKRVGLIAADAENLLVLLTTGPMLLGTGCSASAPQPPDRDTCESIGHAAPLSTYCAGLRLWCYHSHVQIHFPVGNML